MRPATADFLKSLFESESLEKGQVTITHLGGSWKCGSCGASQGYDDYTCKNCGHDSAGPKSKHVFTKDHVKWYHDMEAKEAQLMPSMAKSLGAKQFFDRLEKYLPCHFGTTAGSRDDPAVGVGRHGPKEATHIFSDEYGHQHTPVCQHCADQLADASYARGDKISLKPIKYGEPDRKLHPDVAINAKNLKSYREEKSWRDGGHTGGNGPMQKAHTDPRPHSDEGRCHWVGGINCGANASYEQKGNPHSQYCLTHKTQMVHWGLAKDEDFKKIESVKKSLGYQGIIDELRKSPRRKLKEPPEGMPESMHASWRAYDGVSPAVMRAWKNPNHEMHHAYLAKEWTRKNTNMKRYGVENPRQDTQGVVASPDGQRRKADSDELKRIKTEHNEQMTRIAGQESLQHVPAHVAASREAYIKDKTSTHDSNGVKVGGSTHLNYERGLDVLNALGKYHRAGKMSEKEHLRSQNFQERFHDTADDHEEKTGSYQGVRFSLAHMHPAMLELSHRAMQAHGTNPAAKALIRHANDAAEIHKP